MSVVFYIALVAAGESFPTTLEPSTNMMLILVVRKIGRAATAEGKALIKVKIKK